MVETVARSAMKRKKQLSRVAQHTSQPFKGNVERIPRPRTVSAFREKGVLSVTEFFEAGYNLDAKCPTRSLESGEPSKRKTYLTPDKPDEDLPSMGGGEEDMRDILVYVAPDLVTPTRVSVEQQEHMRRKAVATHKNERFLIFKSTRGYRNELIPPPSLPEI